MLGRLIGRALDQPAVDHVQDFRHARGHVAIVRDHQHGHPALAIELDDELVDLIAGLRVEVAGGLVCEENTRLQHERTRERDTLLLTTRELAGTVLQTITDADAIEQRLRHDARPRASPPAR